MEDETAVSVCNKNEGYSWGRVAKLLGVTAVEVRKWVADGELKVMDTSVTDRAFETFCLQNSSELNFGLMDLAAFQQDNWVGEIGQGFSTVTVLVQQPPVKHEVKMKDFVSWLGRQGRSPAEVVLKQKLEKILGKVNHART